VDPEQTTGEYQIQFEFFALNDRIYIPEGTGVEFEILDENEQVVGTLSSYSYLNSNAQSDGDYYEVDSGDTESFILTVILDNTSGVSSQYAKIRLKSINCRVDSTTAPLETLSSGIYDNAQTDYLLLQN
jgi:hypothetical protein